MPNYTVSVTGNSTHLHSVLFPPIRLDVNKEWEVALLDFTTFNSIPNIIAGENNVFYYGSEENTSTNEKIVFETGSYELEDINRRLKNELGEDTISLVANNNLLRSELTCKFYVDFSKKDSIGSLLGFSREQATLKPNEKHLGADTVNIIKVNVLNITCNIVHGAYNNGSDGHILHSFYPNVGPGYKILERPHNLVYLPINVTLISDIVLDVLDQNGEPVDFRGEVITLRLHIKERD